MTTPPSIEPADTIMAGSFDLTLDARAMQSMYEKHGIPLPISGDIIATRKIGVAS